MRLVPYWLDTAEPFSGGASEPLEGQTDVVVIGAGFTGLAASIALARKGAQVTLLERDRVGWGASGRNGGMCTTGLAIGFLTAVKRYGLATAETYFRSYCDAIDTVERLVTEEEIDCHFKRTGKINLACKPAHYEQMARIHETLAGIGYDTALVPRSDLRSEIGSDHYHGGIVDHRGAGLHVGKLAQGLARAAHGRGVRIHEQTEVTGLNRISGHEHEVATANGTVRAKQVLLATGSTTGRAFKHFQKRILPVGSFIIVSEPLSAETADELLPTRRMASDSRNLIYYFRITPDQRLLFGGRAKFSASDPREDVSSRLILEKGMLEVFPQLRGTSIDYCWGGLVDMTMDRMPHAGEHDGLYYSMGYSGHGVQMSTYMGVQMAEVMGGNAKANVWRDLPWSQIPCYGGTPWFLPAVGVYYRAMDVLR
jgi:glycine/D-amino acid oxidase-like deaminating enzyme